MVTTFECSGVFRHFLKLRRQSPSKCLYWHGVSLQINYGSFSPPAIHCMCVRRQCLDYIVCISLASQHQTVDHGLRFCSLVPFIPNLRVGTCNLLVIVYRVFCLTQFEHFCFTPTCFSRRPSYVGVNGDSSIQNLEILSTPQPRPSPHVISPQSSLGFQMGSIASKNTEGKCIYLLHFFLSLGSNSVGMNLKKKFINTVVLIKLNNWIPCDVPQTITPIMKGNSLNMYLNVTSQTNSGMLSTPLILQYYIIKSILTLINIFWISVMLLFYNVVSRWLT